MGERYLVNPDIQFIEEVIKNGGDTLKKCFQCATCSVACPIAPEESPFPRKEMIAAQWGLKDKLIGNADIWLCHECGDCSTLCPRGAKPGDVLSAVRSLTIAEYATPQFLGKAVNDQKKLPFLIGIPALWFALMAFITMTMGETMTKIFHVIGLEWSHGGDVLAHANFVSTWLIDVTFVPLSMLVTVVFALGLIKFVKAIHENAVLEGKTDKPNLDIIALIQAVINIIPSILKHEKFSQCEENEDRSTAHMMVLYSFLGLAFVTGVFCVVLYVFHIPGPYSQINPVKWIANVSGVALLIGSGIMLKNRLSKEDQTSTFKDWYLIGLVFSLALTGLLSEMTRLAGAVYPTYFMYYLHLIAVFNLFAFLPYSKMAHFVYRVTALGYAEYSNRR